MNFTFKLSSDITKSEKQASHFFIMQYGEECSSFIRSCDKGSISIPTQRLLTPIIMSKYIPVDIHVRVISKLYPYKRACPGA